MKFPKMEVVYYQDKSRTPGWITIYCRITMDGDRAEIGSTGIKIPEADWLGNRVADTHPLAMQHNQKLLLQHSQLLATYNLFLVADRPFSVHQVRERYLNKGEFVGFATALDKWLDATCKRRDLSAGSKKSYGETREKILAFLVENRLLRLGLEEFGPDRFDELRQWMLNRGHKKSYVRRILTVAKQSVAWAAKKKLCAFNPLAGEKVKNVRSEPPIFLTVGQFEELRMPFQNEAMQRVADVFVVYCRTGFHYNDLKAMARNAEQSVRRGIDGQDWIFHDRMKTEVTAKVPVFDDVRPIVEKYGGWQRLPILSNQKMNQWLKLIAADRKWPEPLASKISVKTGRKTFADYLINVLGVSEASAKLALGLKSGDSLDPYVRVDERRLAQELRRQNRDVADRKIA